MKKPKILTQALGKEQRYNLCMDCGGKLVIYVDDDNHYAVKCTQCNCTLQTEITAQEGHDVVLVCRENYNELIMREMYFTSSLSHRGLQNGDFVMASVIDGFIEFEGGADDMIAFLAEVSGTPNGVYVVYQLIGRLFYPVGITSMSDLAHLMH